MLTLVKLSTTLEYPPSPPFFAFGGTAASLVHCPPIGTNSRLPLAQKSFKSRLIAKISWRVLEIGLLEIYRYRSLIESVDRFVKLQRIGNSTVEEIFSDIARNRDLFT